MKHRIIKIIAVIVILVACFAPVNTQAQAAPAKQAQQNITYVVQPGDSLSSLAVQYCTTWQEIYNMNSAVIGPDPNVLYVGMVLTIPAGCPGTGGTPPPSNGVYDHGPQMYATGSYLAPYYTVAWGDTLYGIGQRFGMPYQDIMTANGLTSEMIYAGQVLYIPTGTSSTPPPTSNGGAERVYFAYGATSASLTGTVSNGQPKTYVLTAWTGQTMYISGSSHGEPLTVSMKTSSGQTVNLSGTNSQINFNVQAYLPYTDDYFVTFTPTTLPESPSLTFTVTFTIK